MSQRVLIISPHFPPINAPDHQRVRMSLPYFRDYDWEPYILTVQPDYVEGVCDALLETTIPENLKIRRTKALSANRTRLVGLGNLGLRSLPYLRSAGNQILAEEKIDLLYFSTTMFSVMALGRQWKERFGVPYVIDLQDPWLSDYYKRQDAAAPPGGRIKHGVSNAMAQILEPYTMRQVSHIISVSPAYPETLMKRYSWLQQEQFTVLPFGAPEKDFEYLDRHRIQQKIFDAGDGKRHWVYVGAVPNAMHLALRALFSAIQQERVNSPEQWNQTKLHFVGTNYASGKRASEVVMPIACEMGIGDMVEEHPHRISYFEALQVMIDSDAIVLIGSDDPGYTASKIYPCILARKPILAIFHQASLIVDILRRSNGGRVVTFSAQDKPADLLKDMIYQLKWLLALPKGYQPEVNWSEIEPYTAREMTRQQCMVFDRCRHF